MPADDIPSPCIGVCRLDPAGETCEGCLRTVDEIARWSGARPAERLAILRAVDARRARTDAAHAACVTPGRR